LHWDDGEEQELLFAKSCRMGFRTDGITVMAVTNLPCEFPADASIAFSEMLLPYVQGIAELGRRSGYQSPTLTAQASPAGAIEEQGDINVARPVARATMLYRGNL